MQPSIVLFGDSITEEAFGEGNHYSRSADVVLRGYNTRWAALVAGRAVASIAGPVAVFSGANDAALPGRACAHQHVPIAEYKDNLRAICALLKKRWPSVVVILITPPPVDEDGRLRYPYAHDFSGRAAGPHQRGGPAWRWRASAASGPSTSGPGCTSSTDGRRHSSGTGCTCGNRVLFEEVVFALKDANLSLEPLPADLPLFADMDPDDPAKAFDDQEEH